MSVNEFLEEREEVLEMEKKAAAKPVGEPRTKNLEPLLTQVMERLERIERKLDRLAPQT